MAALFGVVFPSREVGCLPGAWPGGLLRDRTGRYDMVCRAGIFLGVSAAVAGRSVDGKPFPRLAVKEAAWAIRIGWDDGGCVAPIGRASPRH